MDQSETPQRGPAGSAGTPTIAEVEQCILALVTRGTSLSAAERNTLAELGRLRKQLGERRPIDFRRRLRLEE
jgi:hypothetical protein